MLRHLRIFIAVCEEEGMTKAAEKLHMTQPTISQAIRELETHYGTRLFERFGHRLILTESGARLLGYAYQFLRLDAQIEDAMHDQRQQSVIRIGASVTIGESVLVDLLEHIDKEMPGQRIYSEIHNTTDLETMILNNELDIALVEGEIQSAHIVEKPFLHDELIFIAAPSDPLATRKTNTPAAIKDHPFFIREQGSGTRQLFEKIMQRKHITYRTAGIYNNAESLKKAVAAGLGISVISYRAVQTELEQKKLASFTVPGLVFKRTFRIIYHKDKFISPALKNVLSLCRSTKK